MKKKKFEIILNWSQSKRLKMLNTPTTKMFLNFWMKLKLMMPDMSTKNAVYLINCDFFVCKLYVYIQCCLCRWYIPRLNDDAKLL